MHHLDVTTRDGTVQWSHPVDVHVFDLGAVIEQHLHQCGRSLVRGQIERSPTGAVRVLFVGVSFQKTFGGLLLAPEARPTESRQAVFVLRGKVSSCNGVLLVQTP